MTSHPFRTAAALVFAALCLAPQVSFATGGPVMHYPQLAKPAGATKLRVASGSIFPQIDVIPRGEAIIVHSCANGWCQISQQDGGPTGFMTDIYLIFLGEIKG